MTATLSPRLVAIDTDPGIDDALALMLAFRSPELQVELITTVAGNVPVARATSNAQRLLALLEPSHCPPVVQGAARPWRRPLFTAVDVHGQDGLGGVTELQQPDGTPMYAAPAFTPVSRRAVSRLLQLVEQHGQALTLIALGPLTNVAHAIQRAPDLMRRLGRFIIMGGAIAVPGNVNAVAEFNICVDPHAAAVVFRAGLAITLVPLDVTQQVRLHPDFFQRVAGKTRLAQATRHMTRQILQRLPAGMALHDPLAVAVAIDASLVNCQALPVVVETRGQHTLGMTVADRRPRARRATDLPYLDVAMEVDAARVLELFAARVLA